MSYKDKWIYRNWNKTFWGNKLKDIVAKLNEDVPASGPVKNKKKRPMLEKWRQLSNAYYRYYNDGDNYTGKLRRMFEKFGVECPYASSSEDVKAEALEALADKVFYAALLEKDVYEREQKEAAEKAAEEAKAK